MDWVASAGWALMSGRREAMSESGSRSVAGSGTRGALWWRKLAGGFRDGEIEGVVEVLDGDGEGGGAETGRRHDFDVSAWVEPSEHVRAVSYAVLEGGGSGWAGGDVDECGAVWGHGAVEGEARAEAGGVEGAAREGDAGEFADGGNGGELAGIEASAADGTDELFGVGEACERSAGGGFHGGKVWRGALRNKEGMGWECAIRIWIDAEWVGQAGGVPARSAVSDYRTLCIHEKISSSLSAAADGRCFCHLYFCGGGSGCGAGPDGAADSRAGASGD